MNKHPNQMNHLSLIVAMDERRAIGQNNRLMWHLPGDMKRFREITTGHTVIMGRNTFESLPAGALPNRTNIVLSSRPGASHEGCLTVPSLQSALEACANEAGEVFIIGGGSLYEQALPKAGKIYLTIVHHVFDDADTFFPPLNAGEWNEIERQDFPSDDRNPYPYSFLTWVRKK
jgi:dihydrofolate reductase